VAKYEEELRVLREEMEEMVEQHELEIDALNDAMEVCICQH
jgi:hypothetical protein